MSSQCVIELPSNCDSPPFYLLNPLRFYMHRCQLNNDLVALTGIVVFLGVVGCDYTDGSIQEQKPSTLAGILLGIFPVARWTVVVAREQGT